MKRLLIGVALTLACSLVQARAGTTPSVEPGLGSDKPPSQPSQAKGLSGARRYQLLFSPDLDVVGALKMPPEVSPTFSTLPWIPTLVPVTLGANIQYIGANEIQSLQFVLDGTPLTTTTCTAPNANYESTCTFSSSQSGSHSLAVRLTDTEGKVTDSAPTSVSLVNSIVNGKFEGFEGPDSDRVAKGWACSTAIPAPLEVSLWSADPGSQSYTKIPNTTVVANIQRSDLPTLGTDCKSNATAYGFRIPIPSSLYATYSGKNVRVYAKSAITTQGEVALALDPSQTTDYVLNAMPLVHSGSISAPASAGQYSPGEAITLSATVSDADDGVFRVEFLDGVNVICYRDVFLPPGTTGVLAECNYSLSVGSHRFYARAIDRRSVFGATIAISNEFTITPGTPQFSQATYSIGEADGQATITVTRAGGSSGAVNIFYWTTNVSAVEPGDYTKTQGQLYWPNGDTVPKTFTVPIINDSSIESAETIRLDILAANGVTEGTPRVATLTITDDDSPKGTLQFSAPTYSVNENGTQMAITVTRVGGSAGQASVQYATSNGTAVSPGDYTTTSGSLSWNDGDAGSKTFIVPITNDTTVESSETVTLMLSAATGATLGSPASATLTITDDDTAPTGTLQFSASAYSVNESGPQVAIEVTRIGGSAGQATVQYATTSGGTAASSGDYTPTSGTLSWSGNDAVSKTFVVPITSDSAQESDETIKLVLSSPTGATLGSPSTTWMTILDDDAPTGSTVTIVKPAPSSQFPTNQAILIEASLPNPAGVTRVDFSAKDANNDVTTLGSASVAPYVIVWNEVPAGTYRLTASAISAAGATPSAEVTVSVTNIAPSCQILGTKAAPIGALQTFFDFMSKHTPPDLRLQSEGEL